MKQQISRLLLPIAVPDSLNAFSLNPFSLAVPYCYWGFAPNPTSFFVLTQKRRQKRSRLRLFRSKNRRSEGSNRPTCWSSMNRLLCWKGMARTSTSDRDDF